MDKEEKYYVAYGSNLNAVQMSIRCPNATIYAKGELPNFELVFRGNTTRAYLTIEPCEGKSVPIVVWKVTPTDENNLDFYEGYPRLYRKETVNLGNDLKGFTYIMNSGVPKGRPTEQYMKTCMEGYDFFEFDKKILTSALNS